MDPRRYTAPDFGSAVREPGNRGASWHFKPAPIPRDLALEPATIKALSDAGISVEYAYAFLTPKAGRAYVIIRVEDNDRAVKALADNGIEPVPQDEFV